jgi:hypothetical protein
VRTKGIMRLSVTKKGVHQIIKACCLIAHPGERFF